MKKLLLLSVLSVSMYLVGCSSESTDDGDINPPIVVTPPTSTTVEVSGDITSNTTWTADKIYLIKGNVYVTNNVTLTIEPGTIIKGDKPTKGALVITRGAKINATGTADKPIVFTSNQPVNGRSQGDWGGVVLLGKAPNNTGSSVTIEGISDASDKAKYGGTDPADNSGVLKYVRIEYAGIPLGPDNELNGLTMGSVGSGTTIDYVSVYRSGDDAFEWFGGTVNAKHLVAIATFDDDFDTDFGYSGKVQFAVAQRLASTADVSGSNGFESDNLANGANVTPQTSAVFSNVTILGPRELASGSPSINANYQHAAQVRRNSAISIANSVFVGYTEGIFYDDAAPANNATPNSSGNFLADNALFLNNLVYTSNSKGNQIKASNATALAAITAKITLNNTFNDGIYGAAVYTDPYRFSPDLAPAARAGVPNFVQVANSSALTGASFAATKYADAFFDKVAYRGAFGTENWASGWVAYDPQVLPYTTPGAVK